MPMKPKPSQHDRRSYRPTHDDNAQDHTKNLPGRPQSNNGNPTQCHNEIKQGLNSGVRKTAKPKVFTPSNIEASVIKALTPVLQARDGTIYSFSDWTLSGEGAVIVLPNGQEFWLTITEAK